MTYAANVKVSAYPRGFAAAVLGSLIVAVVQMGAASVLIFPFIVLYASPFALAGSAILVFPVSQIGRYLSVEGAVFYCVAGAFVGFLLVFLFSGSGPGFSIFGIFPGAAGGICWWRFGRRVVLAGQGDEAWAHEA